MEWTSPAPLPAGASYASEVVTASGASLALRLTLDDDATWSLLVATVGSPWRCVAWGEHTGVNTAEVADIILFAALSNPAVATTIEHPPSLASWPPHVEVSIEATAAVEDPPSRLIYAEDVTVGSVVSVGDPPTWASVIAARERGGVVSLLLDIGGVQTAVAFGAIQAVRLRVDP